MRSLAWAAFLFLAAPALAQTTVPLPSPQEDATVLHLSEFAERVIKQDRIVVTLRAEAAGTEASRVQSEINRRMTAALERARNETAIRAETRGYWVSQERPANAPPRWRGQQTLILTSLDTVATLALAGELQQGGLIMSGLNFELARETARAAEDELTAEAIKRLRERTERVALTMNLAVKNIRDLRVGQVGGQMPPRTMAFQRAEAAGGAAPPVGEPGDTTVRVNVDAEVVLIPRGRP